MMNTLKIGDTIGIYYYTHRRILGKIDRVDKTRAYVGDVAFKIKYTSGLSRINFRQKNHEVRIHHKVVNPIEHPAYFV